MICFLVGIANGDVVLIGRNITLSFDDTEAAFGKILFRLLQFPPFLCDSDPIEDRIGSSLS